MNRHTTNFLLPLCSLALAIAAIAGDSTPMAFQPGPVASPMIQFASTNFDFGKAVSGEIVKHDFWFTNTGAADLVLSNAYAHCGCSKVIEWTRLVKPGGAGMVSAQFDTALYNSPASKLYTVECNDRRQPVVSLWVTGTVAKMFDVIPIAAYIELQAESPFGRGEARITNYTDQPLFLSDPHCTNRLFGAELKTNVLGKDYLVVVSNTAAMAVGAVATQVSVHTSLANLPVLSILAMANMKALVEVSPAWITLPPPPIPTNQWSRFVVVVNNSTNPLTLSDPVVSSKDVGVSVRALDPGQRYSITLTFPPDFRLAEGQSVFFTAKTSNSWLPEIKVPINQENPPERRVETADAPRAASAHP